MIWVQIGWILLCSITICWGSWETSLELPSWTWLLGFWYAWVGLALVGTQLFRRISRVHRLLITVGAFILVGYGRHLWGSPLSDWVQKDTSSLVYFGIPLFLVLSLWLWIQFGERRNWSSGPLLRFTIWLTTLSSLVFVGQINGFEPLVWERWLAAILILTWFLDLMATCVEFKKWSNEQSMETLVANIFCSRWNPIASMFDRLEELFGIDIQGTWIIQYVRSLLEPLAVLLIICGWLSTSMVIIHPTEQAVRTNFGVPEPEVLSSGFHLKWPTPLGSIHRVTTQRIHQLSIGHVEDLEELDDEGGPESILWANQHASEEFLLLLGDGHDVISADGVLEYRISDAHAYLFQSQNPEEVLESVVYQVLMDQTSSRTLEQALSENLSELAQTVTQDIQDRMKSYEMGIEPIVFTFSALHPPVSVAKDYQEVVSAQIDVLTKQYRAQQYQLQSIPKARSTKFAEIEKAKQAAANLIASANGEAASFEGLRQTVRQAQDLYRFRVRQDNLQQTISGKSIIILDHRLEQQGATLWIEP